MGVDRSYLLYLERGTQGRGKVRSQGLARPLRGSSIWEAEKCLLQNTIRKHKRGVQRSGTKPPFFAAILLTQKSVRQMLGTTNEKRVILDPAQHLLLNFRRPAGRKLPDSRSRGVKTDISGVSDCFRTKIVLCAHTTRSKI